MNDSERFIHGLKTNDLQLLKTVPKSDLHNHFSLGGSREYIFERTNRMIPCVDNNLADISEMHKWVDENVSTVLVGKEGRVLAVEATFAQAVSDGVTVLEIGEDVWGNGYFYNNNVLELIDAFKSAQKRIAPDIELKLQIGLSRHCSIKHLEEWIEPFWDYKEFYSIDLYGDELGQPIENFKGIYRKAKENGLVLKAHVGEFGDADAVKKAVSELELNEVQHGIAASTSKQVMNWLRDHHIQLNICPTSNLLLSRVASLKTHPIRVLYDHGIKVTINSDDVLVFNSPVSGEYLKLFNQGTLNAEELDHIRKTGLASVQ